MLRVVLLGPQREQVFQLFKHLTMYPNEISVNPSCVKVVCSDKMLEVWATNGNSYERELLYTRDNIFVIVSSLKTSDTIFPAFTAGLSWVNTGYNVYQAVLEGSDVTKLGGSTLLVDSAFSSVSCLLQDIAAKFLTREYTHQEAITSRRRFVIEKTLIDTSSLLLWLNYIYNAVRQPLIRVDRLYDPDAARKVLALMHGMGACVIKDGYALMFHFAQSATLRKAVQPYSTRLHSFTPKLSLFTVVTALLKFISFTDYLVLDVTRDGVYYVDKAKEIIATKHDVIVGARDPHTVNQVITETVKTLQCRDYKCFCNHCNCAVISRHVCIDQLNQLCFPVQDVMVFLQKHANMLWSLQDLVHIALVKPTSMPISTSNDLFQRFDAHRADVHLAFVDGTSLIFLERNFYPTSEYNAWIAGKEYTLQGSSLVDCSAQLVILETPLEGYLSMPYAIPCFTQEQPTLFPSIRYCFGIVTELHTFQFYKADNTTVYINRSLIQIGF